MRRAVPSFACGALLGTLLLGGCGGVPPTRYYTVALPAPAPEKDARTSFVLDVSRFQAAPAVRDDRILYFQSPTEMNYYQYHRWSAPPAQLIAELAAQRLRGAGVFREVRLFPRAAPGDYVLRGRLTDFEELDDQPGGRVRVGLELSLLRTRDHQVVWRDARRVDNQIEGKGVAGVVSTLNESAGQMFDQILPGLISSVEAKPE